MLLERDRELEALDALLGTIGSSGGKVVLIRGEAGIGKSALVAEFLRAHAGEAHVAVGFSDNLVTPQPLGPFWDFARQEPTLTEPLEKGDRPAVLACCLDLLSRSLRPTILVIEDTQWADEATLDAVRYLGRRIARTNGLLLLTYRDGEVDFDHPLRAVIGELPPQNLVRIHLDRLSGEAVAAMVAGSDLLLDDVMALTNGNPHFVTEVVTSGVHDVPSSVQDSVLARAARMSPGARRLLDLVSVNPGRSERTFIEGVLDPAPEHLTECVRQGLLDVVGDTVSFHHELTRRAIESALSTTDRRRLNGEVLAELAGVADLSRLVHHALGAEDLESIIEYAPKAARAAMACQSYREAEAHFRTLEPYLDRFAIAERASVLDDWARTAFYLDDVRSIDLLTRTIELRRSLPDGRALARTLMFAIRVNQVNGRPDTAEACSVEAISILEPTPGADLAFALSQRAWLGLMRSDDNDATIEFADRAIAIAQAAGDELAMIYALVAKGSIEHGRGNSGALALVEESHRLAQRGGHRFEEVYALINLTGLAGDGRQVQLAADFAQRAGSTAARYEIRSLEAYAQAVYAEILQWTGDWEAAEDAATNVLGSHTNVETLAWRVLGTLQSRQGRPGAHAALDCMWALAEASGELQSMDPAAAALAEHMWLTGEVVPEFTAHLHEVFDRALGAGRPWPSGSLVFWMWELGELSQVPEGLTDPYRLIIEGDPLAAARMWSSFGCPYERAIALTHGDQVAQLEALEVLETLGATAVAAKLRKSMRDKGLRLPRGKGRTTRAHAGGLTARQAEVLELLDAGLSNTKIADRLFVSLRTVEHHVSAVLAKLNSSTREQAVSRARADGLLGVRAVHPPSDKT